MKNAARAARPRIHLLDELRGLSILLMVGHHFLFSLGYLFGVPFGREWFQRLGVLTPVFAGLFIFLCGLCCHLSHNNWLRGGELAGAAVLLSAVAWLVVPEQMIWFGILHCLAVCVLLFALLRPLLRRVPAPVGLAVCALLFVLTYHVPLPEGGYFGLTAAWSVSVPPAWAAQPWLLPFGFSLLPMSDYFPLLPWGFLFLAGTFVGRYAAQGRFPAWTMRRHLPPLAFIGRHTLLVYLLHQPVICGALWLWFRLFPQA